MASGRITIARPGGILYRMLIHQVYPLSLTSVAFPEGAASVKTLPTINREGAETDLNEVEPISNQSVKALDREREGA